MPIVKCYEHPRFNRKYYPIEDKALYIDDLKHEAFEIMKSKWFEREFPIIQRLIGNNFRSMHHVFNHMNYFREETMKSFCWDVSFGEYSAMWSRRQFYRPIVVSDHVHSICVYDPDDKPHNCVIVLNVIDWGYLEALSHVNFRKLTSTILGKDYDSEIDIDFKENRITFYTQQPDLVSCSRMYVDQVNAYRYIEGANKRIVGLGSETINDYFGKIRLY
jgi:hypothetical protein